MKCKELHPTFQNCGGYFGVGKGEKGGEGGKGGDR